jgi:hypothetical protein
VVQEMVPCQRKLQGNSPPNLAVSAAALRASCISWRLPKVFTQYSSSRLGVALQLIVSLSLSTSLLPLWCEADSVCKLRAIQSRANLKGCYSEYNVRLYLYRAVQFADGDRLFHGAEVPLTKLEIQCSHFLDRIYITERNGL